MTVISLKKMPIKPFKNRTSKVWGDGMFNVQVDRRSHDRIPANIQTRFFCGNRVYAGNILDLSEKGMFIRTEMRLPVDSKIEIMILVDRKVVRIPVSVRRTVDKESAGISAYSGMGVELIRPVREYTGFINTMKPCYGN